IGATGETAGEAVEEEYGCAALSHLRMLERIVQISVSKRRRYNTPYDGPGFNSHGAVLSLALLSCYRFEASVYAAPENSGFLDQSVKRRGRDHVPVDRTCGRTTACRRDRTEY